VDAQKERLNKYYYEKSSGDEAEIGCSGDNQIELELSTELLNNLHAKNEATNTYELKITFDYIKKFKLKYVVNGSNYAEELALTKAADDSEYINETYLLAGEEIDLIVVAKDNIMNDDEITIEEAKYNIKLSGCLDETATEGKVEKTITLNSDKELTITLEQKPYTNTTTDHIYNNVESFNTLSPDDATGISNIGLTGNLKYGNQVSVKFNRINDERGKLAIVRLNGNDSGNLIIHIKDTLITSVYNATTDTEYVVDPVNAKHAATKLEEVASLIDKLQEIGYKFSFITEQSVEKVQIDYTVKNNLEIKTEYLCYLSIKPII